MTDTRLTDKLQRLNVVVDGERYRTATSWLLADDADRTFLFRSLNSAYFVQRPGDPDQIEPLTPTAAQALYDQLPYRHEEVTAAFPRGNGGVGMDTATRWDDDIERERLGAG
jgi:hypothetical protein